MKKRPRFANNAVVINSQRTLSLTTETDESSVYESFPIACFLTGGKMHGQLSNAWDEYKIEAVEITVTPSGTEEIQDEEKRTLYIRFFTCIDNNRPPINVNYAQLKANSTYKDTTFSLHSSNTAPIHRTTFNMNQRYTSTKTTSPLGTLTLGLASSETFDEPVTTWWSCNFRFHVSYRKARVDTGYITTMIPSSMPEISGAGLTCNPVTPPPIPPPPGRPVLNCVGVLGAERQVIRFEDFVKCTTELALPYNRNSAIITHRGSANAISAQFAIYTSDTDIQGKVHYVTGSPEEPAWYANITTRNAYIATMRFGEYKEDDPNEIITKVGIDPYEHDNADQEDLWTGCTFSKSTFDVQGFNYDDDENI